MSKVNSQKLGDLKYFLDVTCYHSNYDVRLRFVYFCVHSCSSK